MRRRRLVRRGAASSLEDSALGASIAVNGVCLTVVGTRARARSASIVGPETLVAHARSAISRAGDHVNLERPLRLGGLVGGHLVQGHVDGVGIVTARRSGTARRPGSGSSGRTDGWPVYLIPQGSVAVDGVSLTVAALDARASRSC